MGGAQSATRRIFLHLGRRPYGDFRAQPAYRRRSRPRLLPRTRHTDLSPTQRRRLCVRRPRQYNDFIHHLAHRHRPHVRTLYRNRGPHASQTGPRRLVVGPQRCTHWQPQSIGQRILPSAGPQHCPRHYAIFNQCGTHASRHNTIAFQTGVEAGAVGGIAHHNH